MSNPFASYSAPINGRGGIEDDENDPIALAIRERMQGRAGAAQVAVQKANPEQAGRANRLGEQLGVPADAIEGNLTQFEAERLTALNRAIMSERPVLREWASDPRNAAVSKDDLVNVAKLGDKVAEGPPKAPADEGLFGEEGIGGFLLNFVPDAARSLYSGAMRGSAGFYDAMAGIAEVVGGEGNPVATYIQRNLANPVTNQSENSRVTERGFVGNAFLGGIGSIPQSFMAAGLTMASGGAASPVVGGAALTTLFGLPTAGESYRNAREQGLSPVSAGLFGLRQGAVEVIMESAPMMFAASALGKLPMREFLTGYLGKELPTEIGTTILQTFDEFITLTPDRPLSEWVLDVLPRALAETAIATLGTTGGMAVMSEGTRFALEQNDKRQKKAQADVDMQYLSDVMEGVAESKTYKRDPGAVVKYLASQVQGTGAQNILVNAEALRQFYQGQGLDPMQGEDPFFGWMDTFRQQMEQALAVGGEVAVPTGEFLTRFAKTPLWEAIKRDIRITPDGISVNEAIAMQDGDKARAQLMGAQVAERITKRKADATAAKAIYAEASRVLSGAGYAGDQLKTLAAIQTQRAIAKAQELGVEPLALFLSENVRIEREVGDGVVIAAEPATVFAEPVPPVPNEAGTPGTPPPSANPANAANPAPEAPTAPTAPAMAPEAAPVPDVSGQEAPAAAQTPAQPPREPAQTPAPKAPAATLTPEMKKLVDGFNAMAATPSPDRIEAFYGQFNGTVSDSIFEVQFRSGDTIILPSRQTVIKWSRTYSGSFGGQSRASDIDPWFTYPGSGTSSTDVPKDLVLVRPAVRKAGGAVVKGVLFADEVAPAAAPAKPTGPDLSGVTLVSQERIAQATQEIEDFFRTLDQGPVTEADENGRVFYQTTIPPSIMTAIFDLTVAYIEAGPRDFPSYREMMTAKLGPKVRPFLPGAYMNASLYPGLAAVAGEMTPYAEVVGQPSQRPAPTPTNLSTAVTERGREVQTRIEVVDMADLIPSDDERYDQTLQPRDRGGRAQSAVQVQEIAGSLDPQRLGDNRLASQGAPIIGPDNMVESGNGRTMAIREAYASQPERAAAYRAFIEEQGFDTAGMKRPVLVRRRITSLSPADRLAFVREANEDATSRMSAPEQAKVDAARMGPALPLYRGGEIFSAGNAEFVRKFAELAVSPAERGQFIDKDGMISQDGIKRIERAMMVAAYGESPIIDRLSESKDDNIKAIAKAIIDAAPRLAGLRAMLEPLGLAEEYDIGSNIAEMALFISRAREAKETPIKMLEQMDAFNRISVETEALVRLAFKPNGNPRAGGQLLKALMFYADEVDKAVERAQQGAGLFGGDTEAATAREIIDAAAARLDGEPEQQGNLLDAKPQEAGAGPSVDPAVSGEPQGPRVEEAGGTDATGEQPGERFRLIEAFRKSLREGVAYDNITKARSEAGRVLGRKIEGGTVEAKMVEETMEAAVVLSARDVVAANRADPLATYNLLVGLYGRQPRLATRTSTSVEQQAYSTPVPLAWLASVRAGITLDTTVYEPSAGNGALLIGAAGANVFANELNPDRAEALKVTVPGIQFIDTANAASHSPPAKVARMIANPPFGVVKDERGDKLSWFVQELGWTTSQIDHAITFQALKALEAGGKAVLIVGGVNKKAASPQARSDAYNAKDKREFYYHLYRNFNVTDHFTVAGELYERQGAAWPVDVIVIEGRGKSALRLPAAAPPRLYESWEGLANAFSERPGAANLQPLRPDAGSDDAAAPNGASGLDAPNIQLGAGQRPGQSQPADAEPGLVPAVPADGKSGGAGMGGPTASGGTPAGSVGAAGNVQRPDPVRVAGEAQTAYIPRNSQDSLNTLLPANMADPVHGALDKLIEKHGDLSAYVSNRLKYDPKQLGKYFSAEQVDALALAIDNIEKGAGFIIGDQTGIGKGRVVAGVLRYAMAQGITPIFVTEKKELYPDMFRDLSDIGTEEWLGREIRLTITNNDESVVLIDEDKETGVKARKLKAVKKADKEAEFTKMVSEGLNSVADVIFTTYDQVQGNVSSRRRNFLLTMGRGAVVVMDESHNAGGTAASDREPAADKAPPRSVTMRDLVARSKGTIFSSATYAKRPQVMDLYANTDMKYAVKNIREIGDAIASGGVPLQQAVAAMLSQAGQYIRRERTFDGIDYRTPVVAVDRNTYDRFSQSLGAINSFYEDYIKEAIKNIKNDIKDEAATVGADNAVGTTSVHSSSFTSIMHNLVGQMLLAIKADAAADLAIEAIRNGEKPVLTLSNTMEAFISQFATDMDLKSGDVLDYDFSAMLKRYLKRTLRYTVKPPGEKKGVEQWLSLSDLGPGGRAEFERINGLIDAMDLSGLKLSPIDHIKQRIRDAGFTVEEITGRNIGLDYGGEKPVIAPASVDKLKARKGFNAGTIDALILNRAGSTGISLHASKTFKDKRPRRMILVQPELNIDTHMQMLGRINRTGQIVLPSYDQLIADVPAEKRPAAVLAAKMASLNANTTAARDSAVSSKDVVDFMNDIGGQVVADILMDDPELAEALEMSGGLAEGQEPVELVRKFTGRIPMLPLAEQEALFETLEENFLLRIAALEAAGESPLEAKTVDLDPRLVSDGVAEPAIPGIDSPFAGEVRVQVVNVKRAGKPLNGEAVLARLADVVNIPLPSAPLMTAMDPLRRAGFEQANRAVDAAVAKHNQYIADMVEVYGTDAKKADAFREEQQTAQRAFREKAKGLFAGQQVVVRSNEGAIYGVVIGFGRTGKAKSPLAESAWRIKIAVVADEQVMEFNLSQTGEGKPVQIAPTRQGMFGPNVIEDFDKFSADPREDRTIYTGNMLKARTTVKGGSIVNMVMPDGSIEPAMMMRRGFDHAAAQASKDVEAVNAAEAMELLTNGRMALRSADGSFGLSQNGRGVSMYVQGVRANTDPFTLDRQLRALGGDWVRRQGRFILNVYDRTSAERAVEIVLGKTKLVVATPSNAEDAKYTRKQARDMLEAFRKQGGRTLNQSAPVAPMPVVSLDAPPMLDADRPDYKATTKEALTTLRAAPVVNKETGATIAINRAGIEKTASRGHDAADMAALLKIDLLLANAALVASAPSNKPNDRFIEYRYYGAAVSFNGKTMAVRITTRVDARGQEFYDAMTVKGAAGATVGTPIAGDGPGSPAAAMTIEQVREIVNGVIDAPAATRALEQTTRGRIRLTDEGSIITLMANADESTLLHEMGHLWLEELKQYAERDGASEQIRQDWLTVQEWFAREGYPIGDGGFIPTEAHEMWARGIERYFMEGKSPSPMLASVFRKFAQWLTRIYQTVDALNSPITPEIRQVMGRLLTVNAGIEAAIDLQASAPMFESAGLAERMGMSVNAHADYLRLAEQARGEALDKLLGKVMGTIRAKRKGEWRDEREKVQAEVEAEIAQDPILVALQLLRTGKRLDAPDMPVNRVRLSRNDLGEIYGSEIFDLLPRAVPPMLDDENNPGGLHPDDLAEMVGASSGGALIEGLKRIRTEELQRRESGDKRGYIAGMVEDRVDALMEQRHSDLLSEAEILAEARDLLANEKQGEVYATELRALTTGTGAGEDGPINTPFRFVRDWAARQVELEMAGTVSGAAWVAQRARAAAKAGRDAYNALLDGNKPEAAKAKQRQMVAHGLHMEAKIAHDRVKAGVALMRRLAKRQKAGSIDIEYFDRIKELLWLYGFLPKPPASLEGKPGLAEWMQAKANDGEGVAVPARLGGMFQIDWTLLTVMEFDTLVDSVRNLQHMGRLKNKIIVAGREEEYEGVVREAIETGNVLPDRGYGDGWSPEKSRPREWLAGLIKAESIADWLDNRNPNGVFNRLLIRGARDAENMRQRLREQVLVPVAMAFNDAATVNRKRWEARHTMTTLRDRQTGRMAVLTGKEMVALALNMGNESNIRKMTEGFGWSREAVMEVLDEYLTEADWDFVQQTWDQINTLWPEIMRVERAVRGITPEKIDAQPLETKFGTIAGGYYPVVYDRDRTDIANQDPGQEAWDMLNSMGSHVTTATGHTVQRTQAVGPLSLSLESVLIGHVQRVVTRIAYAEYVRDSLKFLRDPRIRRLMRDKLGLEYAEQLVPWLKRQVQDGIVDHAGIKGFDRFMRAARVNTTIVGLGLRWTTGMAQIAGLTSSANKIGARWVAEGIGEMLKAPRNSTRFVFARSEEMARRNQEFDRDVTDFFRSLSGNSSPLDKIKAMAFWHIGMADRYLVAMPTWLGAYKRGMMEGMTEDEAVAYGDKAVRASQGSGRVKDLSAVQAPDREGLKMFTLFYSYFNIQLQEQWKMAGDVRKGDVPGALATGFWMLVAAPIMAMLLTGDWPEDEDDDGFDLGDLTKAMSLEVLANSFAGLPLIRDLASYAKRKARGQYADYTMTPVARAGDSLITLSRDAMNAYTGEEVSDRWLKHAIETPGYFLGLPTGQPATTGQFLFDVYQGDENPDTVSEWYMGLTRGKRTEETR